MSISLFEFLVDIERLFIEANRIVDDHGFMVLYFRPQQRDWVSDLNKLKDFGRRHGFEPLLTISAGIVDPSMRALASAAWTFKNDVCFIFLKLQECERRWYEGEVDIDELVFLAADKCCNRPRKSFCNHSIQPRIPISVTQNRINEISSSYV